ncbi:MAG: ABC transporter permease [Bacteroidetes bacterium]|nr:MAG: ABC transporter permease [Bacteroidota bacterium]
MNWNTLLTFYRFMLKSKTFTAINLIGLTAGLTVSFFLLIYIINELSYNSFPAHSDRIYRVITHMQGASTTTSPSLLPARFREHCPGIEQTGGIVSIPFMICAVNIKKGSTFTDEPGFFCADPELLDMLTIYIIHGEDSVGLQKEGSVLLSRSAAHSYFGEADPIGRQLEVVASGIPASLTVTGIFEDLPWNSTMKIDVLAGMDYFRFLMEQLGVDLAAETAAYLDAYSESYILVDDPTRVPALEDALPALLDTLGLTREQMTFSFQNIGDIHLDSEEISNDVHLKGSRSSLFYYGSLAFAILLLAGINYSILSTARSALRYKEIGVRKVLGATRRQLRLQILTESMLLTFLALPLSFLVLGLAEPFITQLYGYKIQLYTWNMLIYIPLFALITLVIGVISGGYLAFYLSALNPLKALKNEVLRRKRVTLGKLFIVFQLLITLILFASVLIIFTQLNYCLNPTTSIQKKNLLIVTLNQGEPPSYRQLYDRIRNETGIVAISGSSIIPPSNDLSYIWYTVKTPDSLNETYQLENYFVDNDFFTTLGIELIAGHDIQTGENGSTGIPVILNQEAEKLLHLPNTIGTRLSKHIITGVVRNFSIHSFYSKITPAVFIYEPAACTYLVVRCLPGKTGTVRAALERHWQELAPDRPFECSTFGDELSMMYEKERKFSQVVASFSFLAFIITGMGLFGLALLMIERRLKEIAVRKIFGASNNDILFRMQKEFLLYILLASVVAVPVTWYIMNLWLSSFYYKVPLHWYLFLIAILSITIFVSSIIVIRTWAVLRKNLINVLRYE